MKKLSYYLPLAMLCLTNITFSDTYPLSCSNNNNPPSSNPPPSNNECPTGNKCGGGDDSGQCCRVDGSMGIHPGAWKCDVNSGNSGMGCTWWFNYDSSTKTCSTYLDYRSGIYKKKEIKNPLASPNK